MVFTSAYFLKGFILLGLLVILWAWE